MPRLASLLATLTLASALPLTAAGAAASRIDDRAAARRLIVRYLDAIRDDDKTTACRIYRLPTCGDRKPFGLRAYEIAVFQRLHPPAEGDWGSLVYLYAAPRSDGTRDVAVALAVVTCRLTCRISGFSDTRS